MIEAARDAWDIHWERYADSAELNPAQKYRRRLIFDALQLSSGARVLDIGSGQGDFAAETLSRYRGVDLLGLDISERGISAASRKVPTAKFLQHDLTTAGDAGPYRGWATHAVCSEVLEHLDDPAQLLHNAAEYMGDDCRLVTTVPGGPMSAFDRHIGHRRHFAPNDLSRLLASVGFEVELATGAGLPFFNLYRCVVILRGRHLIRDVAESNGAPGSQLARTAMSAFDRLFRYNSAWFGWQTLAIAQWRTAR
jgi:SAM-dependent methyltransferase